MNIRNILYVFCLRRGTFVSTKVPKIFSPDKTDDKLQAAQAQYFNVRQYSQNILLRLAKSVCK